MSVLREILTRENKKISSRASYWQHSIACCRSSRATHNRIFCLRSPARSSMAACRICLTRGSLYGLRCRTWLWQIWVSQWDRWWAHISRLLGGGKYCPGSRKAVYTQTKIRRLTNYYRQWVFYVAAIVTGILAILLLTICESRPTVLLIQEVRHLRRITGDHSLQALNPDRVPGIRSFARNFAFRPAQLLFTEPIIAVVSIVCGISTGLIYLFTDIQKPFKSTRPKIP